MTRFQGRGKTRRPNCEICNQILVTAYIRVGNAYKKKPNGQKLIKIGMYCKRCKRFEYI